MGTILYELLVGRPPFSGMNPMQLLKNIERSDAKIPSKVAAHLSRECVSILRGLLRRNPVERMSFDDFFSHPFLNATTATIAAAKSAPAATAPMMTATAPTAAAGAVPAASGVEGSHLHPPPRGFGTAAADVEAGGSGGGGGGEMESPRGRSSGQSSAYDSGTSGASGAGDSSQMPFMKWLDEEAGDSDGTGGGSAPTGSQRQEQGHGTHHHHQHHQQHHQHHHQHQPSPPRHYQQQQQSSTERASRGVGGVSAAAAAAVAMHVRDAAATAAGAAGNWLSSSPLGRRAFMGPASASGVGSSRAVPGAAKPPLSSSPSSVGRAFSGFNINPNTATAAASAGSGGSQPFALQGTRGRNGGGSSNSLSEMEAEYVFVDPGSEAGGAVSAALPCTNHRAPYYHPPGPFLFTAAMARTR